MSSPEDAEHLIKGKVKDAFADHEDFIETVYNKVMELVKNEAKVGVKNCESYGFVSLIVEFEDR